MLRSGKRCPILWSTWEELQRGDQYGQLRRGAYGDLWVVHGNGHVWIPDA